MRELGATEVCMVCRCTGNAEVIRPTVWGEGGVFASWKCPHCGSVFEQSMGEIDPDKAEELGVLR